MFEEQDRAERLWKHNWLNIRKATDVAKTRNNKMYVAFELANTVINNDNGNVYPFVFDTWDFIKKHSQYHLIISTYFDEQYVSQFLRNYNLKCDWVNMNPHFKTSRPFYDCCIDSAAGFHAGEWMYVLEMFKMSEKLLKDTPSKTVFKLT